jgi:hypothetical protein
VSKANCSRVDGWVHYCLPGHMLLKCTTGRQLLFRICSFSSDQIRQLLECRPCLPTTPLLR